MRKRTWLTPIAVMMLLPGAVRFAGAEVKSPKLADDCSGAVAAQARTAAEGRSSAQAIEPLFKIVEKVLMAAAEVMPADKYPFAPTSGEFTGVRTFGQQVKHLAATNFILGAAALGKEPPADAGDEMGPDSVRTKAEIMHYLQDSFAYLHQALIAIDDRNTVVKSSPISPLQGGSATGLGLVVEALIHAFDHYGQIVEYLRMNGIVPPASRG
jgi:hypothetical protein